MREEWPQECDCSCPGLLDYDVSDPCFEPCGPDWRYDECRDSVLESPETETSTGPDADVCALWDRVQAGEGVPEALMPTITMMAQGMGKDCHDMTPEEKEAFRQTLELMLGM